MKTAPDISRTRNPHPRRPPAHQSVSLRHSPPATKPQPHQQPTTHSSPTAPASDKANPPSSVSPQILNKQSSGESSDAGKWFENTNNNAGQASFVDNDPPFLLQNSSSSETPPDGQDPQSGPLLPQATSMPYRPGVAYLGTDDNSSADDFRSVIDDLTIANKRLKQKLKKYEKLYDAHLQDEKLFEVRFHGLPDHKKKELEETLRKFAISLDRNMNSDSPPVKHAPPPEHQTASSHTSRFAESGYASMSASGQHSSSAMQSGSGQESSHRNQNSKAAYNRQQQNVHSYLHDIPAGLLPKSNAPMTEKSKKKLVVRRLEQIYSGKRSVPGTHPQPMQQQEVANSAALADRQAKEAGGLRVTKEGLREARIMPLRTENDEAIHHAPPEAKHKMLTAANLASQNGSGSPDQRPTRPLDLDPYRAQVPAENMEYIRHLGFTPPDMASGASPEDGHGWIYLNLLINMAQLHTINVTPDFVRNAVTDYSDKFELSHDGRKIRWRGGHDTTRSSNDSSSENLSGDSQFGTGQSSSPGKRLKTQHSGGSGSSSADPERQARRMARAVRKQDQNKFAYTPLFFHKEESDDDDDFFNTELVSSSNSPFRGPRGDSSGLGSSAVRSGSSSKKRKDAGPMIFYNKAKFCTDLSGDQKGISMTHPSSYHSITTHPIGATNEGSKADQISEDGKGPLEYQTVDTDAMDLDDESSSDSLKFSPEQLQNDNSDESMEAIEFEVSGLGGVQPDDNFAINVNRRQTRTEDAAGETTRHKHYSSKICDVLQGKDKEFDYAPSSMDRYKSGETVKTEIISTSKKYLPSSTLPPASFLPFDSTSSGDVDSDLESDASSEAESEEELKRTTALNLLNISPTHITNPYSAPGKGGDPHDDDDDCDEDSSEDGSVDFLATARAMNPEAIYAREREYDANFAERLAEDIPAGSSAATAGGGSGFSSPVASIMGQISDDSRTGRPDTASGSGSSVSNKSKNLKRSRTTDSLPPVAKSNKNQKTEG